MSLSPRGEAASTSVLRFDLEIYFEAVQNLYHKTDNPEGTFPLNMAENKLCWPLLKQKMQEVTAEHEIPDWVANYTSSLGAPPVRAAVAAFMSRFLTGCLINPNNIAMSAGATSVIEMTAWLLGSPGDVAVFPAPAYPVYKQDVGNKAAVERYDLVTHHEVAEIAGGPILRIEDLENALEDIKSQDKRFRMLVLTTPDNPTGGIFDSATLAEIADWCIERKIHLIVNEIYGLSLLDTAHPELKEDYDNPVQFKSFANIIEERKSDYLHLWYAFSKDFGASGFRVGLAYSHNEQFVKAYANFSAPHMVSNYTQWVFQKVLEDHEFVDNYIKTNQSRLTASYLTVVQTLRKLQIPYVPSFGSLFVWIDLSEFLAEQTQEAENEFWMELYNQTGILLTPGEGFGHSKKGQFRVVYTSQSKQDLEVAMERLERYVEGKR